MAKKRGNTARGGASAVKTNKRRKVDAAPRTTFKVNELDWKRVELPDLLDDAEGFYGLEEIDDVEIIRDPEHGEIKFQVRILLFRYRLNE